MKLDLDSINILNIHIVIREKVEHLGVILDADLSMDEHISNVSRSIC